MSTSPAAVPTTPSLHTGESYQEKALRKFKEQPLVPIGTLITCGALIMAMVKMRRGDSQSLNNWLRVRVIAQGATIAAVCAGTYAFSSTAGEETKQTRQLDEIHAHREARAGRDRKEFEDRLKDAERQWKETQDTVSGKDLNTNIAKGVSTSKSLPVVNGSPSSSSRTSSSWWGFGWLWSTPSASSTSGGENQKKS
ncbi:hypothetical protein AZE42_02522 [Rhizopogon vesiculosus]|uniref:HIG1 domain-containing protein n=1 Tax=Rhizopogon vesiculosus TaxID=180088 RepID=A0A1J8R617_9AGAM|nr:hypothetical protein AZE42_02522 [Rhizopogon vesiculosus]